MSEEPREPMAGADGRKQRSGKDRRQGEDRRKERRGIWNLPILKLLLNRRKSGERRKGADRRQQ